MLFRSIFVTFRLHGSLPRNRYFAEEGASQGHVFAAMDRLLDRSRSGPFYLRQPEVAQMVCEAIEDGQERFSRYKLHSFVVMPNHVHMLVTSLVEPVSWLRGLKGFTGNRATRLFGIPEPFWQDESFDRLVRDGSEFGRITDYIANNPVRAGLAATPEEFPWSSLGRERLRNGG